jgi:hypothetical protein
MQGNLVAVSDLLCLHSEIAGAVPNGPPGAITGGQVSSLLDLLHTHPLAAALQPDATQSAAALSGAHLAAECAGWQNRVKKLRTSGLPLLTHIPELDTVLRMLAGEAAALEHSAGVQQGAEWAWAKLAVAQLLYVYPPPLNRQDLSRIMESCMSAGQHTESSLYVVSEYCYCYLYR